jgi:pullulanase/glycogen debranching enzyme
LNNIYNLSNSADWLDWNEVTMVNDKLQIRKQLLAKSAAEQELPKLKDKLKSTETRLKKLSSKKGFITGVKIKSVKNKIEEIQSIIAKCEKEASYQSPSLTPWEEV